MYHDPVMLQECMELLAIQPAGTYVDVTFGGGGHSRALLSQLGPEGRLFAFDQDPDAAANAPEDPRFTLIPANFEHLQRFLRAHGVKQVDGILADLGVSSHQFDAAQRGFSLRESGPLDMRMNPQVGVPVRTWLETVEPGDLARVLAIYGEVAQPMRVAKAILAARDGGLLNTTADLVAAVEPLAPRGKGHKVLAQVFQALRIEINRELAVLETLLEQGLELLAPQGRFVVMSYHSLEDRRVKVFFREGKLVGEADRDFYGNRLVPFELITRKAVVPTAEEVGRNPRARSAKLRAAEKLRIP
jgi:16S rRNA (cytosine1402-N4)-methyltransferase